MSARARARARVADEAQAPSSLAPARYALLAPSLAAARVDARAARGGGGGGGLAWTLGVAAPLWLVEIPLLCALA